MKKLLLFLFIGALFAWTPISLNQASQVAQTFIEIDNPASQLENIQRLEKNEQILGFVCNLAPQGFVFIAPVKEFEPVISFSYDGDFQFTDVDDNFLKDMIETDMSLRLSSEDVYPAQLANENIALWEAYSNTEGLMRILETMTTYGPLTDTEWSQSSPYFNSCPIDPMTDEHCVVGCVATALGQLINYWEYPPSIEFRSWDSYTSRNDPDDGHGERVIEIDATAASIADIDYDGSGSHPTDAVMADILYASGVSVKMKYSSEGSSAYTSECASALRNRWNYDDADVFRDVDTDFYNTLQNNLRHSKPALLSIFREEYSVGHAIVCDGWRDSDNMYHVNYGWGGYYCGPSYWYSLPDGLPSEFIILHQGILNITPPPSECASDAPDNCSEAIELTITSDEQTRPDKIDSDEDEDWYLFDLQADVEYTFYTSGPSDTYGEIRSSCYGSAIRTEHSGGEGENFNMVFTPSSSGEHYLRIPGYYYSPADTYVLHYRASATLPPDIIVDYPDGGETFEEGEEIDIYWLSEGIPAISEVKIELSMDGPFGTFTTITERTDNNGEYAWLVPPVDSDETNCIIRISDADDPSVSDVSDFEFTITDIIAEDASNSCWSALSLPMNTSLSSREDAIDPAGDIDYYSFELIAGHSYSFYAEGSTDTWGALYNGCSSDSVIYDDDSGDSYNFSFSYTPEMSGSYKLKVRGYDPEETTGDYTIFWQDNGISDAPDDCYSAITLDISSTEESRPDAISGEDDYDWFEFYLEAGMDYHFYTTGATDTYIEIYSSCGGSALASDDDGGSGYNCHLNYSPEYTGTYYVMIWGYWEGPGDEEYTFKYYENVPEILVVSPEGGEEVFEGSNITIQWLTESIDHLEDLTIAYSVDGAFGPWTDITTTINDEEYIWEATDVTGIEDNCFIKIYHPDYPSVYDVSEDAFTIMDIPPEEGGDDCGSASDLFVTDYEQTQDECLAPQGDIDFFRIDMTSGYQYMFYTTGNTDTYAELYDDCIMPRITYDDDSGFEFNCKLFYTPSISGIYYLAIKGYSETTTGDYTLHYIYDPDGELSVDDAALPEDIDIVISPNPFNGAISIDAPENATIRIFDMNGHLIADIGDARIWQPDDDISSGNYMIHAETESGVTIVRAVYIK
ncbi:MAG: C10 family peptidase [Candidatus Zixiibacteriota bacterium]